MLYLLPLLMVNIYYRHFVFVYKGYDHVAIFFFPPISMYYHVHVHVHVHVFFFFLFFFFSYVI